MKWLALLSLIAANFVHQPSPVVQTSSGRVRGRVSENGKFYEYLGIPYGRVDSTNRFQAPLPPLKWDGILEAVNENTWCTQPSVGPIVLGETDCLKLNVLTPVKTKSILPVMVYIHGGCFFFGSGSPFLYGGDFLTENDVIYVGINYRLSVEGFLCLGIKEAPGNAGLRDQIAALKWIQENIQQFGGDPNSVTLFGESAGAVSTSLLILSPAAKDLFHKAILQSGSSLVPWGLQHNPIERAGDLVKKLGYSTTDPYEIYKILSNTSASDISNALYKEGKLCLADKTIFVPCVENQIDNVEPVVTEYPTDVIMTGNYTKLPMIIGYTDNEGIFFVAADYGQSVKNNMTLDIMGNLQTDLQFPNEWEKNCTIDRIRKHYFSSNDDEMIMNIVALYSDVHFKIPIVLESELLAHTSDQPIYYYLFKYSGLINMPKFISGFFTTGGASHADELFYLFKPHAFPLPHRYLENEMIRRMVTMWTNFAKYGEPTPKGSRLPFRWKSSRESNPRALVIESKLSTARLWDEASVALWNSTYTKYRRKDYGFKYFGIRKQIRK